MFGRPLKWFPPKETFIYWKPWKCLWCSNLWKFMLGPTCGDACIVRHLVSGHPYPCPSSIGGVIDDHLYDPCMQGLKIYRLKFFFFFSKDSSFFSGKVSTHTQPTHSHPSLSSSVLQLGIDPWFFVLLRRLLVLANCSLCSGLNFAIFCRF